MDAWTMSKYSGPRRWLVFWMVMLMLVMVQFFSLVPLLPLSEGDMSFATYFLVALFILIHAGRKKERPTMRHMKPLLLLMASVFLSFIPAYLYYHQSFFQSFLTYRKFLCYLTFPLLLTVRPTKQEIRYAFYIFTVIWLILTICVTFYMQSWVVVSEGRLFVDEGDILHCLPGSRYICVSFILALDHYLEKRSLNNLNITIFMFICVFVMFSRTILVAAMIVIAIATISGRTVQAKVAGLAAGVIFIVVFTYLAMDQIGMLIEETSSQVSDMDYNRNKAIVYMFSSQRNLLTVVLGNGFISGHVDSIIFDLQDRGIFHSDVGLIGMWHQFGLLSVFVIFGSGVAGLSRDYSFLVRSMAAFILESSLTIGYFGILECTLWLSLYWYLMALESDSVNLQREERRLERARRRQRYRSLSA